MFISLFLTAALVLLIVCLCASVLYWYESLNNPEERIPAPKPGIFSCIFHYFGTLFSFILCAALIAAGPFLRRRPTPSVAALPQVILIHGLYNNAGCWLYLARVLSKAGYTVSTYTYSSFRAPLDATLRDLNEHIATVERLAGAPILIGHSLGGMLARKWLAEYDGSSRIRGVITLGTPHGGSKMAVFALGALGQSLRPSSVQLWRDTSSGIAFAREAGQKSPARPRKSSPSSPDVKAEHCLLYCSSLISPADGVVLPASLLLPPEGWNLRLTPARHHYAMLFCPATAAILLEEIRAAFQD